MRRAVLLKQIEQEENDKKKAERAHLYPSATQRIASASLGINWDADKSREESKNLEAHVSKEE